MTQLLARAPFKVVAITTRLGFCEARHTALPTPWDTFPSAVANELLRPCIVPCGPLTCDPGSAQACPGRTGGDSSVTDKDRPRFKTKEAAQEIAARCHAMERQTMVHWRVVSMEDGTWIVAAYKDGWIQRSGPLQRLYEEMAQSA